MLPAHKGLRSGEILSPILMEILPSRTVQQSYLLKKKTTAIKADSGSKMLIQGFASTEVSLKLRGP